MFRTYTCLIYAAELAIYLHTAADLSKTHEGTVVLCLKAPMLSKIVLWQPVAQVEALNMFATCSKHVYNLSNKHIKNVLRACLKRVVNMFRATYVVR